VSQPDPGDALCNSVPSLPSPPAFDRQHAARSKLQWRFSFNIQNVRLREVGRAFLEKGASADDRARLKPVLSEAEGGIPMDYLRLINRADCQSQMSRKMIPEPTGLEPEKCQIAFRDKNRL
jgi:hypothetical protein